jgi:undecaprenyl diphosphate synthase
MKKNFALNFAIQSPLHARVPLHVAVVMDGNGRWAERRGLARTAGHRAGADAVRRVVEAAPELGIGVLTLFAFSADNWGRPRTEVATLMRLLRAYLRAETRRCLESGVRVSVIGRRDRLPGPIVRAIRRAERATRAGARLHLRIALDYSARESIARAALRWARTESPTPDLLGRMIAQPAIDGPAVPDVDLLIRTGGEQRLSDFLLWECAYAELYFTERPWPDFEAPDLAAALAEFRRRERRFGRLPDPRRPPESGEGPPRSTREWLAYFRRNRTHLLPIPWHAGAELDVERRTIARSVQAFQLGEQSEGRHLMRYARRHAERTGDPDYVETTRLFIAEEQRHARDLGRFMAVNAIRTRERNWTDGVFRRLRNIAGTLEISIAVLVTAEIIAKVYYPALREATRSTVLRALCDQIVRDERAHVDFQTHQLARLRAGRSAALLLVTRALQRLLFLGTTLVVWLCHRPVFRRSGLGFAGFSRTCWTEFGADLAAMEPAVPAREHGGDE